MQTVLSLEELIKIRHRLRSESKRVVFTNGCFDILHPGHVRYLSQARALGDVLIVALNSDESVKRLKGPTRPILKLEERAEVISALKSVDYVTVFFEDTPREIISKLLPDILVKGGDWNLDTIVGREEVEAAGGEVKSLNFVDGCSTTDIINRILGM